jgi:hypothetical protein
MPLTPVAITTWARPHCPRRAVGAAQLDGPASLRIVIAAADEFRAGPEVQLHGVDIGFEPVGELVLRDVGRPVRRERHVGQVIDLDLVVQGQRVIALAPIVADPRLAVDDQRVDLELLQPRGDRQPGLSAADHQHIGVAVGIFGGGLAQVEPVGPAEVARIGLSAWTCMALLLLEALQFLECRQQRPGLQPVAIAGIGDQPHDAVATAGRRLEFEDRLDRGGAGAHHPAGGGALGIDAEIMRRAAAGHVPAVPRGSQRRG